MTCAIEVCIGCTELFSNSRFVSRSSLGNPYLSGCDTTSGCLPPVTGVGWDDGTPEGDNIIGLWVTEWVESNPFERDTGQKQCGGFWKPLRPQPREIVARGIGLANGVAAVTKLRNWLWGWVAAGCCDGDRISIQRECGIERFGFRAAVVSVETTNDDVQGSCGFEFEVVLRVASPWLYGDGETVWSQPLTADDACVPAGCESCGELIIDDTCGCAVQLPKLATTATSSECFCPPILISRMTAVVAGWTGDKFVGATLMAGSGELRNLRIRGWIDTSNIGVDQLIDDCAKPCLDIRIGCIPTGGVLTVGPSGVELLTRQNTTVQGSRFISAGSEIPDAVNPCGSMFVFAVDLDPAGTPANAAIEVVTAERFAW